MERTIRELLGRIEERKEELGNAQKMENTFMLYTSIGAVIGTYHTMFELGYGYTGSNLISIAAGAVSLLACRIAERYVLNRDIRRQTEQEEAKHHQEISRLLLHQADNTPFDHMLIPLEHRNFLKKVLKGKTGFRVLAMMSDSRLSAPRLTDELMVGNWWGGESLVRPESTLHYLGLLGKYNLVGWQDDLYRRTRLGELLIRKYSDDFIPPKHLKDFG